MKSGPVFVSKTIRFGTLTAALAAATLGCAVIPVCAQDTRTVTEPFFPTVCTVLVANTTISSGVPASESLTSTGPDTSRIQSALTACGTGKAVELAISGSNNAFLSGPLTIPNGVTLIVDGGVTLFASRNGADYQVGTVSASQAQCGTVNATLSNGCNPFITMGSTNSTSAAVGLMGYGVINGRGNEKVIVNGAVTTTSWWDLASNARAGGSQNNPILVSGSYISGTIYKITLLNSPRVHVSTHYNTGFTAWGMKIITPWTARNTDGFDPASASNITVTNSVIGDGDDEIAVGAANTVASKMTFSNLQLISGHGLSIGSYTTYGVNNIYAHEIYFSGKSADSNQTGLHIKSAADRGNTVSNVTYENVCIQNVKSPISLDPFYNTNSGTNYPVFSGITYKNVHVLTEGAVQLQGYDSSHLATVTFNNVVFDTLKSSDLAADVPKNLTITSTGVVYPALLANLDTVTGASGVTYSGSRPTVSNASALNCAGVFATLANEMYASTATANNLQIAAITNPASVTLNAVVEPTNSEVSYTDTNAATTYTGVAVPTGTVQFLEGATVVGTGSFAANGTLASAVITNPTVGAHTYTARYVGDSNYSAATFGSISVTVTAGPAAKLAFANAPPAALTYGNSAGTVTIAVQDGAGDATTSTAAVTLNVTNGTGYSTTYMANAVSGTATFNLPAVLPAGTFTYTASGTSLTAATANETVGKATLTVTASAASRIFDDVNPVFGYVISNFVNGENASVVSGAPVITAAAARNAVPGAYPTVVSLGTLSAANYNFMLVGGTLTVTGGAAQTIVFAGLPNFPSGRTYQLAARTTSGLAPTYSVTGPASVSGSVLTVSGAGVVTVTASSAGNGSYGAAAGVSQSFTAQ